MATGEAMDALADADPDSVTDILSDMWPDAPSSRTTSTSSSWAARAWPDLCRNLSENIGVPVVDGVAAATKAVEYW